MTTPIDRLREIDRFGTTRRHSAKFAVWYELLAVVEAARDLAHWEIPGPDLEREADALHAALDALDRKLAEVLPEET